VKEALNDEPPLLQHEYDGIQEYDNPLPSWWSGIFILSIVFAAGYWFWFHGGGPGSSEQAQFEADWGEYAARKAEYDRTAKLDVTDELIAAWATDPATLDTGSKIFTQSCVGCHLADGSGQVGPNLTDDFQIHGARRLDLYLTIRDGVPAKGMISWGATMKDREMAAVAAYVSTLRGKNLPGKPAEGGKLGAW
jgi:cytochrome c oxidase cbb3-type subunit 3